MKIRNVFGEHKCFGSMTVNAKGQVVIPAGARRDLGINSGDTGRYVKTAQVNATKRR